MNWRDKILAAHPDDPQREGKAGRALLMIDEALRELASMGHQIHIEEGPPAADPDPFPRVVFHAASGQRTVNCQQDLDDLGEGWFPTMGEARQAAGIAKQMQRGGIFKDNLPSINLSIGGPNLRLVS